MHPSMPPDALPPDDARGREPGDANVVDPAVLAERRAQRAEVAERRAADAQTLAAQLAHERARLEAERDAARAEAAAAREGADAVKVEARHLQAERDTLREQLARARAERDEARTEAERARTARSGPPAASDVAPAPAGVPQAADAPPPARAAEAPAPSLGPLPTPAPAPPLPPPPAAQARARPEPARSLRRAEPSDALARERRLLARRTAAAVRAQPALAGERPGDRAVPVTALALERERSNRLQAGLERSGAVERELRDQVAALEHAVRERREAERRIESALAGVRAELDAASRIAAAAPSLASVAETRPALGADLPGSAGTPLAPAVAVSAAVPPSSPAEPQPASAEARSVDAGRLEAARARLRATTLAEVEAPAPVGPPAPWLPHALRELAREDPATAGRVLAGLAPAQALVTQRPLRYDLVLAGRGCVAVDTGADGTDARLRAAARPRREVDLRVTTDEAGFARLLLGRRGLRRRARVRGARRRVRELRRLGEAPLALRDLARAGVALDPALALRLAALAIKPVDTLGHRFTIAHAPLAGGPADAWLRIQGAGGAPVVLDDRPAEAPTATLRCTRGALLALLAGVEPVRGERGVVDGDAHALVLLRAWIARTEFPKR